MDRNAGGFHPNWFGRGKECEPFTGTPLHLHHMSDDMNGAWMSWVEGERATRYLFGTAILTVLFEAECVHRKDACVAGNRGVPLGQHLGDTISQHAPLAKTKVQGMRGHEREDIARPVDEDCAVPFDRESLIAVEPSTRRGRVTTCGVVHVCALRFDGGHACNKSRSRSVIAGAHDQCGAQAMAEDELGVVGKYLVNLDGGIPAIRKQELKRAFAPC
jgi:hypothetical protein